MKLSIAAALGVSLLSGAYLGLMLGWVAAREDLDAPGYALKEPLRVFFTASLIVAVAIGVLGFAYLRKALTQRPEWRQFAMMSGLLMVSAGMVGLLIIIPSAASLSNSGGLNPDFGHLLTWDNFTGALWLFLLTGAIPYAAAFFAQPSPRPLASIARLALTIAAPTWYVAMAIVDRLQDITAP